MKKLILILLTLAVLMYAEYRYIMLNITPSVDNGTVYLEIFEQVDEYEMEVK